MVDLQRRGNTLSLQVCVCMRACVGGKLTEGICRLLCVGEVVSESLDKCWEKILCKREVRNITTLATWGGSVTPTVTP